MMFIVIDEKMYVAKLVAQNKNGSITVDLYRNVNDYDIGAMMELGFVYWPEINCPLPRCPDYSLLTYQDSFSSGLLH